MDTIIVCLKFRERERERERVKGSREKEINER